VETRVATIERGWYAAQVRPKSEQYVRQLLVGKGYEPFVPVCQRRRRWSDRVVSQIVPLVPNYVFFHVTLESLGFVVTTPRVIRIVGAARSPWPIPEHEIEALRRIDAQGLHAQPWPFFREGQVVQIQGGPMSGVRGILLRVKNEHRLIVSVSLLQRSVAVEIDADSVFTAAENVVA
jgi:transcription antitermination factor NusG